MTPEELAELLIKIQCQGCLSEDQPDYHTEMEGLYAAAQLLRTQAQRVAELEKQKDAMSSFISRKP